MTTLYAFVGSEMRIVDNATFDTKNVEVLAKWVQHAYGEDDETNEDGYIVRNANGVLYAYVKYQCKGDDDVVTIPPPDRGGGNQTLLPDLRGDPCPGTT